MDVSEILGRHEEVSTGDINKKQICHEGIFSVMVGCYEDLKTLIPRGSLETPGNPFQSDFSA